MKTRICLFIALAYAIILPGAYAQPNADYNKEIEGWYARRVKNLSADGGWLNLAGLYWLEEGKNSFGSAAANKLVFPAGTIPEQAGYFLREGGTVTLFAANGTAITINDKPIDEKGTLIYAKNTEGGPAVASYGTLRWTIIQRDDKIGVRLRDLNSPQLAAFTGIERYPVDAAWSIPATLQTASQPQSIAITNILGQTNQQKSPGRLVFSIGGASYSLDALDEGGDDLFIIFGDETSGKTTYPSGRFLQVKKPGADGRTTIDFNKAYNPPCAFTPYATCPIPPKQNILPIAINAGEKNYGHHPAQQLLRVAVVGLTHDHVHNIMNQRKRGEVIIAGIAESDPQLVQRYKNRYDLPDSLFFSDLSSLLAHTKPDAVLAYNAISEHLDVVALCAPKGISVMVEKPLATTVKDAEHIAALAAQYHIHVLTNYETTWYSTNQQVNEMVNNQQAIGEIRKMIVHDGHQGPKEIGCSPDFLGWLTDPVKNGGGAIRDFGCYGANLMVWLMQGKTPIAVTAMTHHIKPAIYPKVDDDATILLEYPNATGIIEASWNWPFSIKDLEVFGASGYLHALNPNDLLQRSRNSYDSVAVHPPAYRDNLPYLSDVLSGKTDPGNDLSSLPNNLIVVRILEAASRSAKEGRRITL